MSESDLIRLKKENHHLKEQVADLLAELEEKNNKMGFLETEYSRMKNENDLITKTKLTQHHEMIRLNVEKAVEDTRSKTKGLEAAYDEAIRKLQIMEQERKNYDEHLQELQISNKQLKKQIIEYGQKTQTTDFIVDIKNRDDALMKKDKDYQKIVLEHNELCDQMEHILSENRLLKELANVPANFGINIEQIKIGDRLKIEDYKAKIRLLQGEVDSLETERAQLKHKLLFLANALEIKEPPFNLLTTEQKKTVADYAQSLYEGREFIIPERYELLKDNKDLKTKIDFLEKQITNMQLEGNYRLYGHFGTNQNNNGKMPDDLKEIIEMLRKENEDLKALLHKSLDKFSDFNAEMFKYQNTQNAGNFPMKESMQDSNKLEMSYLQFPPIPLIDQKDVDNTGYGYSYRFNTKFKIDPSQIHQLFGIAKNDNDIDALKIESASLQVQMIELLEVMSRMRTQDEFLNENLEKLYNKFENLVLLQNELFERYVQDKKIQTTQIENNHKTNMELLDNISNLKKKDKALEDAFMLLETKNLTQIENRAIEKMKEAAILEINYIKLMRKYDALTEEEKKLRIFTEELEKNTIEKDLQMENIITRLKEWKQLLVFYLKFLLKKLKKSVDREEFNKILEENKHLREKYNEMMIRDINVTKQISIVENYKIKLKETEQNFFDSEEMRIDGEIELNYIKKRLQLSDPEYYLQEKLFRKFVRKLNELSISIDEIRKIFDMNNSGQISKTEFMNAMKTLRLNEAFNSNDKELEMLMKAINLDEDNNIDTFYFIRKLTRSGLSESENNDEEGLTDDKILQNFIDGIRNSTTSLKSVFELFDKSGDGIISREEFKFALQQLKFNVSDEMLDKIIILINGNIIMDNNNNQLESINYAQFCDLFDQRSRYMNLKNKREKQIKNNLKIDWKTNILSTIVDGFKAHDMTYNDIFAFVDKNHAGLISKPDLSTFLKHINPAFTNDEIEALWGYLDKNKDNSISVDEFISSLKDCEGKIVLFRNITGLEEASNYNTGGTVTPNKTFTKGVNNSMNEPSSSSELNKLKHKVELSKEKEKYFNYKITQMRNRLEDFEKINRETSNQLEDYVKKHSELMDKYFTSSEEMQRLKQIYESSGVKREDLNKIEMENDSLGREVTVLRVGLNTFKDLYKSTSRQIQVLQIKSHRNEDEFDTYKKAIKDLQSESNQNSLIGKLYYSLLVSRWRESSSLRKYDDFVNDFRTLREEQFKIETENTALVKEATELQSFLHDKIIENIRLEDQLDNVTNTNSNFSLSQEKLEELKNLVSTLSSEKTQLTEKYFNLRRDNLKIHTEAEELRNKIEYSENIVNNIKYNNSDDYSKRIIEISDNLSKVKLNEAVLLRENHFLKETENHLSRLNEHLNKNIKTMEINNSEWESKFRKMDENWRLRDEERQKKFYEKLKNIDFKEMRGANTVTGLSQNINILTNKNIPLSKINEYESKIKELNDVITAKNIENKQLMNVNIENEELLKENAKAFTQFQGADSKNKFLTQTNIQLIKDDETQLVAQTSHKAIKTLQEMLKSKTDQIKKQEEIIENLKNELINNKKSYLSTVSKLQEQIHLDHDSTMKKLKNVLDNVNQNLLVKITRSQLSLLPLADLEALIEEKDNSIKTLAIELKHSRDENEINYLKILDLNKRIVDLNITLGEERYKQEIKLQNDEIEKLKNIIVEKSQLIDLERENIKKLREEFGRKYEDRTMADEILFNNSVHIPERLIENNEKTQLYTKIQNLRNKNKKLTADIEKINKELEESKKKLNEQIKKSDITKNENRELLNSCTKDQKFIGRLKKEKEELTIQLDKLKEDHEKFKTSTNINLAPVINQNQENKINEIKAQTQKRGSSTVKKLFIKEEKKSDVVNNSTMPLLLNKSIQQPIEETSEDILKRLVVFSIKKNINMLRHIQRYDITKLGKVSVEDFSKALDELKLGLVFNDIDKLIKIVKVVDNYVEIREFIDLMIKVDSSYKLLVKEYGIYIFLF